MKKKKPNFVTLIIILVAALMFLINGSIGAFFTIKSINDMKNLLQGKMLDLACSAAFMLDGDELKDLTEADCINKTQKYQNALDILVGFKTSNTRNNAEFAYIYLLRQVSDDTFVFIIDGDTEEPAEYGEETIYTAALAQAGAGTAAFDNDSYVDNWGEFYSAYAPVMTSDGKVSCIVAVDCNASWYKKEVVSNVWSIVITTLVSAVLSVGVVLLLTSKIRRKFTVLSQDTNQLQSDVDALINEINMPKEFKIEEEKTTDSGKGDAILELRGRVNLMQKEIRQYLEYTKALAYIDPLTGMGNRTAYIERLNEFNSNMNEDSVLTVIVFDINGLKHINDTYGHEIGDKSIIEAANRVQTVFGSKVSYRIGGDEMVVILENNNFEYINELISRFDAGLKVFNEKKELPFELAVAKGYAAFDPVLDKSFNDIFNRADGSMYQNKNDFYDLNESK